MGTTAYIDTNEAAPKSLYCQYFHRYYLLIYILTNTKSIIFNLFVLSYSLIQLLKKNKGYGFESLQSVLDGLLIYYVYAESDRLMLIFVFTEQEVCVCVGGKLHLVNFSPYSLLAFSKYEC